MSSQSHPIEEVEVGAGDRVGRLAVEHPDDQRGPLLGSMAPATLFPYAREAISGLVARGGFPEMLLQPINFDALFAQHVKRAQEQAAAEASH